MQAYFYHLTRSSSFEALPSLLEKTLAIGKKAIVRVKEKATSEKLDTHLWSYKEESFLPHSLSDLSLDDCPIFISHETITHKAPFQFLLEGVELPNSGYERLCILFDGQDPDELAVARTQWKEAKVKDLECAYFQQDESGRWLKKA
jgi:DNA polymerase III subunit chi